MVELSYFIIPLLALIGGLYLYSTLRKGGPEEILQQTLGLRNGESVTHQWNAYYNIDRITSDRSFTDPTAAISGTHTRGTHITIALTNHHRLVIGNNEQKQIPISYERGQIASVEPVTTKPAKGITLSPSITGSHRFEKSQILKINPHTGKSFRVEVNPSALIELQAFADPSPKSDDTAHT